MPFEFPIPLTLTGDTVSLHTLEKEHFPALKKIAADPRIWQHYAYDASDPVKFDEIFNAALKEREQGSQYPFVICERKSEEIIGSTRFLEIQHKHKKLEIGATWLHNNYWGTTVNPECKLLLLTFCFETLGAVRVQLKTDEQNIRSRKAIEKTGGHFEGIFRNDMLRDNLTKRNSAYYSFTDDEWPLKKKNLEQLCYSRLHNL